jgi:hypothetical protein
VVTAPVGAAPAGVGPVVVGPVVVGPVVVGPVGVGPVGVARVIAMSGPVCPVTVSPVAAPPPEVPPLPVPCGVWPPRVPPPGVPAPPISLGETAPATPADPPSADPAPTVPAPAAPAVPAASLAATAVPFAPPEVACGGGEGANCEGCLRKTTRRAPAATSRARNPITTNKRATVLLMAHSNPARRTSHRGVVQGSPCGEGHARRLRRLPCQASASMVPPAGLVPAGARPPGLDRRGWTAPFPGPAHLGWLARFGLAAVTSRQLARKPTWPLPDSWPRSLPDS